jgi:hypothetical protein
MITLRYDYTITAEAEFLRWLNTVSYDRDGTPIIRPTKTLDERIAEKELRIKRKIQARLRRERVKAQKLNDSKLSGETLDQWVQRRLK